MACASSATPRALAFAAALLALSCASALDNGFTLPARGWSSWYAAPDGSQVTDAFVRASAQALVDSGLAAKGYVYVNVDEGWLAGRHAANNTIYEDFAKFPSGMAALGAWINALPVAEGSAETMRYGLYSCRGTCQCGTDKYSGPGSHGFEREDTDWMIAAGAKWLKIDSCCGDQNHSVAFADYSKFRDAMNASGTRVWFNLCGWSPWYAPADPSIGYAGGFSLGNSFRIWGDGGSFAAITGALNTMAAVRNWTRVGGYADPDNILGPHGAVGTVTESQARVQMIMWSFAPTQLILGEDVTQMSAEFVETVGNEELLAINADAPFAGAARRIAGSDLQWPCDSGGSGQLLEVHALACDAGAGSEAQRFYFNSSDSSLRPASRPDALLATASCDFADGVIVSVYAAGGGGSLCGGAVFRPQPNGSIVGAAGKCLDEFEWTTPRVDLWSCLAGATNEAWAFAASAGVPPIGGYVVGTLTNGDSGFCLSTTAASGSDCTNVWARTLANGDVALAFLNHGADNVTVACDAACFAEAGLAGASGLRVRDLLAHEDLAPLVPPFALAVHVAGGGAAAALRLSSQAGASS